MKQLIILLFILVSLACTAQKVTYATIKPYSGDTLDLYVYPEKEVTPELRQQFAGDQSAQNVRVYNINIEVARPVRNNQNLDGYYLFAKDPEHTIVRHLAKSGTGIRLFNTTTYKGGVFVKDAKTINRNGHRQYTFTVNCYDATGLYCIANCYINVR